MPWGIAAGALIGGAMSASSAKKNQRDATAANKEAMQNRHTWEVQDLKNAGLNPILSAGGSGTGGMPSAPGAPVPDYGATLTNALQTKSNIDLQEVTAGLTRAKTKIEEANLPNAQTKALLWEEARKLITWWKQTSGEIADELKSTINAIHEKLKTLKLPTFELPWGSSNKNSNRNNNSNDYGTHVAP